MESKHVHLLSHLLVAASCSFSLEVEQLMLMQLIQLMQVGLFLAHMGCCELKLVHDLRAFAGEAHAHESTEVGRRL